MARLLTTEQRALLRSSDLKANLMITMWLDAGPVRFCDDIEDITYLGDTWVGASVLINSTEIRAGNALSAEGVTLVLDGNRLYQAGISDPAAILGSLFQVHYTQRRVDLGYGFSANGETEVQLYINAYAGKINSARLLHEASDVDASDPSAARLEVVLDALAARYNRRNYRTRSHADQQQIKPGDMFFSFVNSTVQNEAKIYWGKKAPTAVAATANPGTGGAAAQDALNRFIQPRG